MGNPSLRLSEVLVYLNFSFFTVFLKNRNISSKIKRSKVTDYAALKIDFLFLQLNNESILLSTKTNVQTNR